MTLVFVYGTLKRGRENHGWIEKQRFIAEARTKPIYRLFDLGGYPGMIRSEPGIAIVGEVWDVDLTGLAKLDVLEDIDGGEYERVPVELEGEFADQRVEGYLYLRSVEGRRDVGACW
ncbi:MAG: gamma-glutamylcyclotransferase [Prosthecobacter sp.]|jgi:gamma-glutamylaminecyclotransferase|uniref:gamma-glutamylcyclotransferase family protein n=1 Tax=Prosthecobacter sp. TaxID=1965333 RepID=UPI001A06FF47|nr:gamma-glutamylcyclotransferase family protein [Prosthecobacter sp.]MBE2284646.1 gamma-glutamylcyclotransferase [Prosthecobacter sp.]